MDAALPVCRPVLGDLAEGEAGGGVSGWAGLGVLRVAEEAFEGRVVAGVGGGGGVGGGVWGGVVVVAEAVVCEDGVPGEKLGH